MFTISITSSVYFYSSEKEKSKIIRFLKKDVDKLILKESQKNFKALFLKKSNFKKKK